MGESFDGGRPLSFPDANRRIRLSDRIGHPQRRADYPPGANSCGKAELVAGRGFRAEPVADREFSETIACNATMRSTAAAASAPSASIRSTSPGLVPSDIKPVGLRAEIGAE
jgi:hypothetical protein